MEPLSDTDILLHIVYHVFLPPKLPQEAPDKDSQSQIDQQLANLARDALGRYRKLDPRNTDAWSNVHDMLTRIAEDAGIPLAKNRLEQNMANMKTGDVLAIHVSEQNAAVLIRTGATDTTFEMFEVQAPNVRVMSTPGKLVRQFPGPAVQIPNSTFQDRAFLKEITNFLAQMSNVLKGSTAKTTRAGSTVSEVRDATSPHYILQLFAGILRGVGKHVEPNRVVKRIGDEVLWDDAYIPWRRSPLWLVIRVALQTTLGSNGSYKNFMLFFHAELLRLCQASALPNDILFVMQVKLARRLLKIHESVPESLVQTVKDITTRTEGLMKARWARIQKQVPKVLPLDLNCENMTMISLPTLRRPSTATSRSRQNLKQSTFTPNHVSRIFGVSSFTKFDSDDLRDASIADRCTALFDFEHAVSKDLWNWVDLYLQEEAACACLSRCIEEYTSVALSTYTHDVADRSIMILNALSLWMALDRLATSQHALLLDYSPEIPENVVDVLLLRSSQHLQQAKAIQLHLRRRHAKSKAVVRGSIFAETNTRNSFAVRFFDQSPSLQALKETIEEEARLNREKKLREMDTLNKQHTRLLQQIQLLDCKCVVTAGAIPHGQDRCQRCQTKDDADRMYTGVHEWPLPSNPLDARMAIFELECPMAIKAWRCATYKILCDLGDSSRDARKTKYHCLLADCPALNEWNDRTGWSAVDRITIASSTKSFLRSHYSRTRIPATKDTVCVNNALSFQLFDSEKRVWATGPFSDASFAKYGTFLLPQDSPYQYLRYALEGTSHTSNQVIASQSECPQHISLHEHYAFGTLRSGPRLQWMNIVRGLEENILSFNRIEVNLLHTQAAWQLGPLSQDDGSRDWHLELDDPYYGGCLVAQAQRVLDRVKGSWLEAATVQTIVTLVARLLTSTADATTHQAAYQFLREARKVTFKWLEELLVKLRKADIKSQVFDYQRQVCEMAAICRSTYNIDTAHLPKLLANVKDWHTLVFCSITLYDNQISELDNAPLNLNVLICRDRRLAHQVTPVIIKFLSRMPRLLDGAISQCWSSYEPGPSGWTPLSAQESPWVSTITKGTTKRLSQHVHLNLVEGKLLVNGKPLGRLPREYTSHPTYIRLFGQKVLDVAPSSSPDMQFTARIPIEGNEISFDLDKITKELIIRARREDIIVDLVTHTKLTDDLPLLFSTDYHHWVDQETGIVEFRPRETPWTSHDTNWRLQPIGASIYTLERQIGGQDISVIDVRSSTFRSIVDQLAPLEDACHIYATVSWTSRREIVVELPRMKLKFFVNKHQRLESENFRNLVVDDSQYTGTMFGLRNQLVLCAKNPTARSLPLSRTVLIPYGTVNFSTHAGHVDVTIDPGSDQHVVFYRYKVDANLGLLTGSTSLTSRLYKIYLHALTSHCLPDPLTGRTGTEEALYELLEPATSSFDHLNTGEAHLLSLIGELTPQREHYPIHLQEMMTTHWLDLPPLAQHYAFSSAANSIIKRASSLRLFNPSGFDPEPYLTEVNDALLERAARRACVYYPVDTAACLTTIPHDRDNNDQIYDGGDCSSGGLTEQGWTASWVSGLVHGKWGEPAVYDLVSSAETWDTVHGPSKRLTLTYGPEWIHLNLGLSWISLYNLCRQITTTSSQHSLCACLAAAAYSGNLPQRLAIVLVGLASSSLFEKLEPPNHSSYKLSDGYKPKLQHIQSILSSSAHSLEYTPAYEPANQGEYFGDRLWRQQIYDRNIAKFRSQLSQIWMDCWPNNPSVPEAVYSTWFDVESALDNVQLYFDSCSRNIELRAHLKEVEKTLSLRPAVPGPSSDGFLSIAPPPQIRLILQSRSGDPPRLEQLMQQRTCPKPRDGLLSPDLSLQKEMGAPADTTRLEQLLADFLTASTHPLHQKYGIDLEASRAELAKTIAPVITSPLPSLQQLEETRRLCRENFQLVLDTLQDSLRPHTTIESIISTAGIWPRLTTRDLLGRLAFRARANTPSTWQGFLKKYARAYIEYQRSQRLIGLALENKREEFYKELDFASSTESEALVDHPDWLLVQIDGNFSIRTIQTKVASEMMSPSSASSTIMQLNMGEGKSSVIVPTIAAILADGRQLVRVVVLKPLWRQMYHLLINRLAGLVGRRIYYLPFGRHIRVNQESASQIQELYAECMREGGVFLVQPEHILSFKLMGIDQLISASSPQHITIGKTLQKMQLWFSENSRDILDESDEILHVRYQLVYTMGDQQPLEGHPDRWTTTQQLLSLVARHISRLQLQGFDKLKYEARHRGQFPFIRILPESDDDVTELIQSVARDVIAGCVPNLNFGLLPLKTCETAFGLVTERNLSQDQFAVLETLEPSMRNGLLLLRGLLACGILVFALRDKHYRVDYGLDLSRSLLAVPYHAKDMPSLRAEFGHPDVIVMLTCLSYYNHGLTDDQLSLCFEWLYKLDNPVLEYEHWVSANEEVPLELHLLNGVNLKDREQFVTKVVPAFAHNAAVINLFLASTVFPKAAKQFPYKLSTSGWDLVEPKHYVTTGFSGTNDNRYLLPTSITQSDLVGQSGTNALVLTYLLRPENNHYVCIKSASGGTCSAMEVLNQLLKKDPRIRVLLDVGAQMLDLQNDELAKYWLTRRPDVSAAVYFNKEDELVIMPQNGTSVPFFSSPFAQQLDKCIVYLDDAHTRGTDLDLPPSARAAVTLGPKVTKDRLLQGCMRLRKLGHGQSVLFCAPPEIDFQIRKASSLDSSKQVRTQDVLRWAILETCRDLEHHVSHWAHQGVEYNRRVTAPKVTASRGDRVMLQKLWMTPESRTLQDMYGVSSSITSSSSDAISKAAFNIPSLNKRLKSMGIQKIEDPSMGEEQEREVSHEVEQEREVERPAKAKPATHALSEDIQYFVRTGTVPRNSTGIATLFRPIRSAGAPKRGTWSSKLLASLDFCNTLLSSDINQASDYMRPLHWLVSGTNGVLLALSPYEVNGLLPEIRNSSAAQLHIYAPQVTQSMMPFSKLRFYTIPSPSDSTVVSLDSSSQIQLGLFAGQLYLESYDQYCALCAFLGIYLGGSDIEVAEHEINVQSDGFVTRADRQKLGAYREEYLQCGFSNSPISGLRDFIGYRRKGMDYLRTHMGQILHGRQLTPNSF
ncbi:hypothetical protein FRC07_013522 [Ceratobasidium sp. 392]|nr:hypothetical protein FRC07_013522 [Ceratobasidium sp. 392]